VSILYGKIIPAKAQNMYLFIMNLEGNNQRPLIPKNRQLYKTLYIDYTWSTDGSNVVFSATENKDGISNLYSIPVTLIFSVNRYGKSFKQIGKISPGFSFSPPVYSPDFTNLAITFLKFPATENTVKVLPKESLCSEEVAREEVEGIAVCRIDGTIIKEIFDVSYDYILIGWMLHCTSSTCVMYPKPTNSSFCDTCKSQIRITAP
jgi:hypothetical protein